MNTISRQSIFFDYKVITLIMRLFNKKGRAGNVIIGTPGAPPGSLRGIPGGAPGGNIHGDFNIKYCKSRVFLEENICF